MNPACASLYPFRAYFCLKLQNFGGKRLGSTTSQNFAIDAAPRLSRNPFVTRCLSARECHRGIRDDFVAQIRLKGPLFGMATDLLSDDTPEEFDSF